VKRALVLVACAGCPSLTMRSPRNAPGHVDLATPPAHEAGDPAAYEEAKDPGEERAMILPGVFAGFGQGRRSGATELGAQLRFTFAESYDESSKLDELPFVWSAWGAAFGWGIVQLDNDTATTRPAIGGPLYAELDHTWSVCGVGAGAAVYPRDVAAGPQVSAWAGPFALRARYLPASGFEIYAGYVLELPTVWVWSK
jgi:hypothetical protein